MKRRMANKIENYKILPKRLINKYMVGTDKDEDVFYGVCLTPNADYIKIEIY